MNPASCISRKGMIAGLLLGLCAGNAVADEVPKPLLSKGIGSQCVAETSFMRRNHMQLLKHQRDETVHQGERGTQHSLKGCINCHMAPEVVGEQPVSIESRDHFCSGCHQYAGIKPDCFECHSAQPEPGVRVTPIANR